jgi:hypothetical protein
VRHRPAHLARRVPQLPARDDGARGVRHRERAGRRRRRGLARRAGGRGDVLLDLRDVPPLPRGPVERVRAAALDRHPRGRRLRPRLVLPARNLHRVPDSLPDAAAALSEPLACVCNSLLDPSAVQPATTCS